MRDQSITANPRYAYQALGETMLRLQGLLTREAERGISDALTAKVYRDSATEPKDPTVRREYDLGWNVGRWIKLDKQPNAANLSQITHDEARKLYAEFLAANCPPVNLQMKA